ncbi:MAG: hypothetical protein HQ558_05945 [Candidatus Omnitrophica bacterium]|nr:hypothetical protein [Candidatus Omnitrophota bacterium]
MTKAILLLSGGLDSILAAKLILEQGIEVEAVNFKTIFCNCTSRSRSCSAAKSAADQLGIKLKVFEITEEYLKILKNPKHGYGKNLNPCLDCRILKLKKSAEYMKQAGGSFLVTGEVLGQRPMSQRMDAMRTIEKESKLEGLILRPLSAKLLRPTTPEEDGLVNREKLLSIQGRSRKEQIHLAEKFSINDYPCPSGGCLLTYEGFANKVRDLMQYNPDFGVEDTKLLKAGRHLRISPKAKLVVGRDEKDNEKLLGLACGSDILFHAVDAMGPVGIGRGAFDEAAYLISSSIIARYSDCEPDKKQEIKYGQISTETRESITILPIDEEKLADLRI